MDFIAAAETVAGSVVLDMVLLLLMEQVVWFVLLNPCLFALLLYCMLRDRTNGSAGFVSCRQREFARITRLRLDVEGIIILL